MENMNLEQKVDGNLYIGNGDGDAGEFVLHLDVNQALRESFTWLSSGDGDIIRIPHEALPHLIHALHIILSEVNARNTQARMEMCKKEKDPS